MEYVDGLSLGDLLGVGFGTRAVCAIISQVLTALAHVHAHGVLHRDIKPDNIMGYRRADGALQTKLTDFGIAASLTQDMDVTEAGAGVMVGTPAYMAPEQVEQRGVYAPALDLYAVGTTMYRLLTGTLPFENSGLGLLVARISESPIPLTARQFIGRDSQDYSDTAIAVGRLLLDMGELDDAAAVLAPIVSGMRTDDALRAGDLLADVYENAGHGDKWDSLLEAMTAREAEAGPTGLQALHCARSMWLNSRGYRGLGGMAATPDCPSGGRTWGRRFGSADSLWRPAMRMRMPFRRPRRYSCSPRCS